MTGGGVGVFGVGTTGFGFGATGFGGTTTGGFGGGTGATGFGAGMTGFGKYEARAMILYWSEGLKPSKIFSIDFWNTFVSAAEAPPITAAVCFLTYSFFARANTAGLGAREPPGKLRASTMMARLSRTEMCGTSQCSIRTTSAFM